jgi:hypothetical protein
MDISVCVYSVFALSCVWLAALRWADQSSKESYHLCKNKLLNWRRGQVPTNSCRAIDEWINMFLLLLGPCAVWMWTEFRRYMLSPFCGSKRVGCVDVNVSIYMTMDATAPRGNDGGCCHTRLHRRWKEHVRTFPSPLSILTSSNCPSSVGTFGHMHEQTFRPWEGCSAGYTAHTCTMQVPRRKPRSTMKHHDSLNSGTGRLLGKEICIMRVVIVSSAWSF